MAKFKIKGKKVTGTKKKDKIVWQKSWKKNLTVDALKGNDTIDFTKSKKTNTFIGGKGNDIIKTGKGTSTIVINKGDGNDTIYHNSKKTTIKVNKAKSSDKQVFERKGNDLILSYTHGGTTTKEVLTFKDYYKGNKNIYLGKKKLETLISSKGMTITSSGNIQGTNGNDTIYGSKGNDTINAGKGNNTIFLKKNEGTDTIQNGGGNDTLIFSQESNFDNFTFTNSGDDLNIKAGGTTAVLKDYNAGKSSVKTIKAGNLSFSKIIKKGNDYTVNGTSGNDLFLLSDTYNRNIKTGAGNDIVYLEDGEYDKIYASNGNNYINMEYCYYPTIYLKDMTGNNTIVSDWYYTFYLDFTENEFGDSANGDEMLRILQLTDGDGTCEYILGQKSGNDLIMKTVNNKTVTVKDFYGSNDYGDFYINDESDDLYLERGSNSHIFYNTPSAIKLTGNTAGETYTGGSKYIYAITNMAYNVTLNNSYNDTFELDASGAKTINVNGTQQSYFNIDGAGNHSINMQNAKENYIKSYTNGGTQTITFQNAQNNSIDVGGGSLNMMVTGNNNYIYDAYSTGSVNITGNNNYFDTNYVKSTTLTLNGTGNYADISVDNANASPNVTVNTIGQNEVRIRNTVTYFWDSGNPFYTVNSKGNDTISVGYTHGFNNTTIDFTGSNNTNKNLTLGKGNQANIIGALDTSAINLYLDYKSYQNYIVHYNGDDFIFFDDFDSSVMKFRNNSEEDYYGYLKFKGAEGAGGADLNSTAFLNKIKVSVTADNHAKYHTLNEFAQYFDTNHTTINHNFTFGNANMGYMSNLTKDYFVHGTGSTTNDTYSNFTFASGRHSIVDAGGSNDTLTIAENISDLRMYFNIKSDGSILNSDLYFVKTAEFQDFMKGTEVANGLNIMNYFGAGEIENIQAGEAKFDESKLSTGSLIAEVVSWMSGKGYADTNAVISTGSDADKTALYTIYNNHNATDGYWVVTLSV